MLGRVQTYASGIDPVLIGKGDLPNFMEDVPVEVTAGVVNFTGFHFSRGILSRTLGAARADVMPTAAALIKAIQGQQNQSGSPLGIAGGVQYPLQYQNPLQADVSLEPGSSFRWLLRIVDAFADTLTNNAGTGMMFNVDGTLGLTNVAAASSWTEYLIKFIATQDAVNVTGDFTNASANVNNVSATDLANVQVGMTVNSAGNVTANTTRVLAVDTANSRIVLSAVATATTPGAAIGLTPTVEVMRLRSGTL